MLWRTPYQTRELGPIAVPPIIGTTLAGDPVQDGVIQLVLGAFDPKAQLELGVWLRLMSAEVPKLPCWTVFFIESLTDKLRRDIFTMTPSSRHNLTVISTVTADWRNIVQPDRPERSFGTLIKCGVGNPLMVGTPTEEALDRFKQALGPLTESG